MRMGYTEKTYSPIFYIFHLGLEITTLLMMPLSSEGLSKIEGCPENSFHTLLFLAVAELQKM